LKNAIEKGCIYCGDFAAAFADVSVGAVGSQEGYSTVIIRTDKGKQLLEGAELTFGQVNVEEISRLSALKKSRAKGNLAPLLREIQLTRAAKRGVVGDGP